VRRRILVFIVVGVVASIGIAALPAFAQTTVAFNAEFKETFGRAKSRPCSHFLCGVGTVAGYGSATSTFDVTDFAPIDNTNCADLEAVRVITLVSDGSTLTLDETGTVCFPGQSFFTPGSQVSFGNPAQIETAWTVDGGTGVFSGATGSGTDSGMNAGDQGHSTLTGTLTLP
jgi:hypothetical protein